MPKILVITSRDLFSDGGEKNLMKNKDLALRTLEYDVRYLIFRGIFNKSSQGADFTIFGHYSLFDGILHFRQINKNIEAFNPDVIVYSGLLSYLFFFLFGAHRAKRSLDYQGALEEIIEYQIKGTAILSKFYYTFFKFLERKIYKNVDNIEIVSDNCRVHLQSTYGETKATFSFVPCVLLEIFDDEKYAENRQKWRSKFAFGVNELAAVYAGGVSKWQCIDDVMRFLNGFQGRSFVFTSTANLASLSEQFPNSKVSMMTLTPEELKEALCAFDFGLLPREEDRTNFVAWPNKASEYYNARLTILLKSDKIGFYESLKEACQIQLNYNYSENIFRKVKFNPQKVNMQFFSKDLSQNYK